MFWGKSLRIQTSKKSEQMIREKQILSRTRIRKYKVKHTFFKH